MLVVVAALLVLLGIVYIAIQELPDGTDKAQNIIALSTSAFGVIGAVVGAYFGVRAAGNAMEKAIEQQTPAPTAPGQPSSSTPAAPSSPSMAS